MNVLELMKSLLISNECTKHTICENCPLHVNKCVLTKIIDCHNDKELLDILHTQTKY